MPSCLLLVGLKSCIPSAVSRLNSLEDHIGPSIYVLVLFSFVVYCLTVRGERTVIVLMAVTRYRITLISFHSSTDAPLFE